MAKMTRRTVLTATAATCAGLMNAPILAQARRVEEKSASKAEVERVDYPSFKEVKKRWEEMSKPVLIQPGEKVLGFFIVGFLLKRPDGGGAVRQTLKVENMPAGTKQFYPWLMHLQYQFFDKSTGNAVERPLWIQFTDLYAFRKQKDWYLQVTGGWADKGDKTPWEGFVGVIGIAVG